MHGKLHDWDKKYLRKPKKRIRKAQLEPEEALNGPMCVENKAKAKELAELVEILLEQEEVHWLAAVSCLLVMSGRPKYKNFPPVRVCSEEEKYDYKTEK
jgi:hypothetical protein